MKRGQKEETRKKEKTGITCSWWVFNVMCKDVFIWN